MIRIAQLLLVGAAAALWVASRLVWVDVHTFDGLGEPKTTALNGGAWFKELIPLAVLLLAAAVAALAVRGWPLRLLAGLVAAVSAGMAYLGISLWVVDDVAVRALDLAEVPATELLGTERHYWGAATTVVAAIVTLVGAVLLMRSAVKARGGESKYVAPAARREAAKQEQAGAAVSERAIWDALDEGQDPTNADNEGR